MLGLAVCVSPGLLAGQSDIDAELKRCSKQHGYDPDNTSSLGAHQLGVNERSYLACAYAGVRELLIPKSVVPAEYETLISKHKQMTDAVEKGELTRAEREARTREMLGDIGAKDAAERERRIQDLTVKREQLLKDLDRARKRTQRRMF